MCLSWLSLCKVFFICFLSCPIEINYIVEKKIKILAHSESKAYSYYYETSIMKYFIKIQCSPDIFRTLVYSQLCYILKSRQIQSPTECLRCRILLRALCNYSIFRGPIYSKLSLTRSPSVSALMYELFFGATNLLLLLYPLLFIGGMTYSLTIYFFSHSLVYELQSS